MECIESANVQFSKESLQALNFILGGIMFGIALELKIADFLRILKNPKAVLVGLFSQLFLLPALTFLLIVVLLPTNMLDPCLALGMILIAACPGGNISNFMAMLAKGDVAMSISMTALVTLSAVVFTPLNFTFWGSLHPETAQLLQEINLDLKELFFMVFILLGLPLILGMLFNHNFPNITKRIVKPIKIFSVVFFLCFVVVAFYVNFDAFKAYIGIVAPIVFLHNGIAIIGAILWAKMWRLGQRQVRSVTIETAIQNSGLALILIFSIFAQSRAHSGMAIVAGWWGIWHIVAGMTMATIWSKREVVGEE